MLDDPTAGAVDRLGAGVPRRARAAFAALAAVALVAAAVAGASLVRLVDVRSDAASARSTTAEADRGGIAVAAEATEQEAFLADAQARLAVARGALAAADDQLDVASVDHATVAGQLRAAQDALAALQAAITGAEGEAIANAGVVQSLATCLEGVSALVNQLSVGDNGGAVRTVDAIGPACAAVGAAIG